MARIVFISTKKHLLKSVGQSIFLNFFQRGPEVLPTEKGRKPLLLLIVLFLCDRLVTDLWVREYCQPKGRTFFRLVSFSGGERDAEKAVQSALS